MSKDLKICSDDFESFEECWIEFCVNIQIHSTEFYSFLTLSFLIATRNDVHSCKGGSKGVVEEAIVDDGRETLIFFF